MSQATIRAPSPTLRAVLIIVVIAGPAICFPVIKLGLAYSPALKFAGLRTTPRRACVAWGGTADEAAHPVTKALVVVVLPLGLIATTFTFGSMFLSPKFTSAAVASVLGNMQPLGVLVFAVLLLGETITRWKVCALLFGLSGVTLIAFQASSGEGSNEWLGAALAFGSSLSSGVASVIFKKLTPSKSLVALTGPQMVAGSLALQPHQSELPRF